MSALKPEERRYHLLRKLAALGKAINMLEAGAICTPELLRGLASRGLVRVTVEITPRGREAFSAETVKRQRKAMQATMTANLLGRRDGQHSPLSGREVA